MNFGNNDQWNLYQKQIQQSQENEELARKDDDPLNKLRKEEPSFVFSAALMGIMKDAISDKWNDLFRRIDSSMLNLAVQKSFKDLRILFQELEERDVSMELDYLLRLSRCWMSVEHAIKGLQEHPNAANLAIRGYVHELLEEIESCSKGQEYPLIHYLKEHAGTSWVPFPFMHILRTLHEEYHAGKPENELKRWLMLVDAVLDRTSAMSQETEFDMP